MGGGANVLGMHIDKRANVQVCQSVWGPMSTHIIFQKEANVRGGVGEHVLHSNSAGALFDPIRYLKGFREISIILHTCLHVMKLPHRCYELGGQPNLAMIF